MRGQRSQACQIVQALARTRVYSHQRGVNPEYVGLAASAQGASAPPA